MSLPFDHPQLLLSVQPGTFFVFKHSPDGDIIPEVVFENLARHSDKFLSVTRALDEISIVGEYHEGLPQLYKTESIWRCIRIAGPMEFELTGVLASFTLPLKAASLPVFVVSTWNTDYILVKQENLEAAVEALRGAGWMFESDK
ncbi:ACT domain-containing protein [Mycena floridula]|nr:ACT domain-containing protein [Mycena floridula]